MPRKSKESRQLYNQQYYERNKEKLKEDSKNRREMHRDEALVYAKQYYQENKEDLKSRAKAYRQSHKNERSTSQNNKRKTNPMSRIHHNISNLIRLTIQRNGSSKNGKTIKNSIGFTIQELKDHIEFQFESWMTWKNWGKYNSKIWDDNDQTTWTWQIDHIMPHSTFKYTSMEDEEFKKCWALNNLRPLSSKQNFLEGVNRIRH